MKIINFVVLLLLITFSAAFFSIIYKGIQAKDYTKLSYALFAANAITCNCLFGFGRSTIFISRFDIPKQKLIYFSAAMFLYAAIITFFVSGWIYATTDNDFIGNKIIINHTVTHQIILISLTGALGISLIFSVAGLIYFVKWSKKAIDMITNEMTNKEL